ncbi:hypothetical protein MS3_00001175 [Schistosoma haematobium]|uniref:UPAR/Ly6 domain-containing protein n=1 Tax=Schistosoma haematobium TaxID=6185 RepID=A0A922LQF2_SCHHA|nr:hypothetical protein MS3_00001175 [Schistosoma haematobium]KAH9591434.1 hypothetical protein MS3_00001175 [Schistosoma haematobium]
MKNREGLKLFTYIILLVIIKDNVDAHIGCYVCDECANPFSSQVTGVSLNTECRFCKTTLTYSKNMVTINIAKSCGQMNETCVNRYIAWYNTTTEENCCITDLCNASNVQFSKSIVGLFISGLIILLTC